MISAQCNQSTVQAIYFGLRRLNSKQGSIYYASLLLALLEACLGMRYMWPLQPLSLQGTELLFHYRQPLSLAVHNRVYLSWQHEQSGHTQLEACNSYAMIKLLVLRACFCSQLFSQPDAHSSHAAANKAVLSIKRVRQGMLYIFMTHEGACTALCSWVKPGLYAVSKRFNAPAVQACIVNIKVYSSCSRAFSWGMFIADS